MSTSTPVHSAAGTSPAAVSQREGEWPLDQVLANRRWVRRDTPFPLLVAENVFAAEFYAQLDDEFHRIERDCPQAFQRNMTGYDAAGAPLGMIRDGPLGIFTSRAWHDMLAQIVGVTATGDVSGSVHHHEPRGANGWPHNDLNPGWFAGPLPGARRGAVGVRRRRGLPRWGTSAGSCRPRDGACGVDAVLPRQPGMGARRRR